LEATLARLCVFWKGRRRKSAVVVGGGGGGSRVYINVELVD